MNRKVKVWKNKEAELKKGEDIIKIMDTLEKLTDKEKSTRLFKWSKNMLIKNSRVAKLLGVELDTYLIVVRGGWTALDKTEQRIGLFLMILNKHFFKRFGFKSGDFSNAISAMQSAGVK